MKTKRFWLVPAVFFLVASVLNLIGRICNPVLAETVKPALMPLLALTALVAAGGAERKEIRLLLTALLFGCTGDILLIFDGFLPFVFGMVAFLTGHIFYICLFGGKSWKGLSAKTWIPAVIVMAALVVVLIILIGVNGAMLVPMLIYAFALMMLIFSGLAGVVRLKAPAWWIILCGGVLFTFSDACIALGTFGHDFAGREFVIMLTYITAQALLATGALKLAAQSE